LISVKRDGVQYVPREIILDKEPLPSLHGTIVVCATPVSLLSCIECFTPRTMCLAKRQWPHWLLEKSLRSEDWLRR